MQVLTERLSIRVKLLAGCGALMLVMVTVAGVQWFGTARLADTARGALLSDAQAESLLLNIDRDSYQAQIAVEQLATAPPEGVADLLESYEGNRDQTVSRWEDYTAIARGLGDERDRWPAYVEAQDRWAEHNDGLAARLLAGDRSGDAGIVEDLITSRELHDEVRGVLDGIVEELYVPQRESFEATLSADLDFTRVVLPVGLLIGSAVSVVVALVLAWNIADPIRRMTARARQIADGQTDLEPINMDRSDELGDLAESFNDLQAMLETVRTQARVVAGGELSADVLDQRVPGELGQSFGAMVESLRAMVAEVTTSAGSLSTSADALVASSATMTQSAEGTSNEAAAANVAGDEVSSSIASVARSIEDMTDSIQEIARSATEASRVAGDAVRVAATTSDTIGKLGESSEEIGNVINVINSIAEQTNLLALNATIEAARAGEAGKGFAVVANEVKELATQTSQATEEISTRIQGIQTTTLAAVEANQQISETIERISDISSTIAAAVEEQSVTTSEIGHNVEAATSGADSIADGVSRVASGAETTRTTSAETSNAATRISDLADELNRLVANYR